MGLVSTVASVLYAALPRQVRCPAPRQSEGARDFDAFIAELIALETPETPFRDAALTVTRLPYQGPARAVMRRARD